MDSNELRTRRTALAEERDQLADRRAELAQQHAEAQRRWREDRIEALIAGTPEPGQPEAMGVALEAIAEVDHRTADLTVAIKQIDSQLKTLVFEEKRRQTAELDEKLRPQLADLAAAAREALARYSVARLLCAGLPLDKADAIRAAELVRGDRDEWHRAVTSAGECLR